MCTDCFPQMVESDPEKPTEEMLNPQNLPDGMKHDLISRRKFLLSATAVPFIFKAGPAVPASTRPAASNATELSSAPGSSAPLASAPNAVSASAIVAETGLPDLFAKYQLDVNPRARWAGRRKAHGTLEREQPKFLLVHHTASSNKYSKSGVPDQIRGAYEFHTGKEKGWPDVAYNFFVDRFGGVWEGRTGSIAGPIRGSATGGNQGYSQLCYMIGDFTVDAPSAEALRSLTKLLAALADRYQIETTPGSQVQFASLKSNRWPKGSQVTARTISGHREMSLTSCPGDRLFEKVKADLQRDVTKLRQSAK